MSFDITQANWKAKYDSVHDDRSIPVPIFDEGECLVVVLGNHSRRERDEITAHISALPEIMRTIANQHVGVRATVREIVSRHRRPQQ